MLSVVVTLSSTKANSPPWARARANNNCCLLLILKVTARANKMLALTTMSKTTKPITVLNSLNSSSKLIDAPTVIKNNPKSKPLKGSISASNSCLNSLSASTTPAKKVPKAGDKPILCITSAIATTKKVLSLNQNIDSVKAADLFSDSIISNDGKEGFDSFFNKRKPSWAIKK